MFVCACCRFVQPSVNAVGVCPDCVSLWTDPMACEDQPPAIGGHRDMQSIQSRSAFVGFDAASRRRSISFATARASGEW